MVDEEDWRVVPWMKSFRSNILLSLFQERLDKGLVLMMSKSNKGHRDWFLLRRDLLEEASVDEAVAQTNKKR